MSLSSAIEKYRDGDYDFDYDHLEVASNPDGVKESQQFVPNLLCHGRRAGSLNDVSRYTRYFDLISANHSSHGCLFTWKHYLDILRNQLGYFEMSGVDLTQQKNATDARALSYKSSKPGRTKSKSFSYKRMFNKQASSGGETISATLKRTFSGGRIFGRTRSTSGDDSTSCNSFAGSVVSLRSSPLTPQSSIVRKVCNETKSLALKICKTVEKMSTIPHKCPSCGAPLEAARHKDCARKLPQVIGDSEVVHSRNTFKKGKEDAKNISQSNYPKSSKGSKGGSGFHQETSSINNSKAPDWMKQSAWGAGESLTTPKRGRDLLEKAKKSAIMQLR